MRLLLDENLDQELRFSFPMEMEVETVAFRRWAGMLDGTILELARIDFDVLITADQKLPEQQAITIEDVSVIVLHSLTNRIEDHLPLIPKVLTVLESVRRGQVVHIYA